MANKSKILHIALATPLRQQFDYLPPPDCDLQNLRPGCRLRVPFGTRNQIGMLLQTDEQTNLPLDKLKQAHELIDHEPIMPTALLNVTRWASQYYQHAIGDVIFTSLPKRLREGHPAQTRDQITGDGSQIIQNDAVIPELTLAQQHAVDAILTAEGFQPFLLDGVTGSGKTEVYLQVIAQLLAQGKQALVLVPEIVLTPQMVKRVQQRFSVPIAVLHSALTDRARQDAWLHAKQGNIKIIIGTRSAIFTPLAHPGIIVVDEEHDASFKQQSGFRYSARDLAIIRGQTEHIPVILGSATPSLESITNVIKKRYVKLHLPERVGNALHPSFNIVDLRRQALDQGLSSTLVDTMKRHLEQNNQVLLFLNRRGYAPILMCHACGWSANCQRCSVRMTLHRSPPRLICHHCETQTPMVTQCPQCQHEPLHDFGIGTERLEETLNEYFPDTEILRIDRDSTRRKGSFAKLFKKIAEGNNQILIGTQILAKGHHFPNVTLVAIIDADMGLHSVDFRASERMAQLIIQVAGRAGRADKPGHVYLQTYQPEHPLLQTLLQQNYSLFSEQLLEERKVTNFPPYSHLALIRAEGFRETLPMCFLEEARDLAAQHPCGGLSILGPVPAPIERVAGRFRAQLLIQAKQRQQLQQWLPAFVNKLSSLKSATKVRWSIDVDPLDMS